MNSIVLRRGSNGIDVSSLQAALAKLGYKLAVDGIFGEETEGAVKRFQTLNQLNIDGIVGEKTHAALDEAASSNVIDFPSSSSMTLSAAGAIDIIAREGICLEPYKDSVGVWTIGIGRTAYDGKDPRDFGKLTLQRAVDLFKEDVPRYADPVRKTGKKFNQHQFDALVSACYNFGSGNLRKLCSGRSIEQIGHALMLYTRPPEITERRRAEQRLYQTGQYQCTDGKVLVFPVRNNHPHYSAGYHIDIRPYFENWGEAQ